MNQTLLKYKITFHTEWHCGSGQSRGADVDALVVKNSENLPYIPGKTMKGLLREAMEEMMFLEGLDDNKDYREAMVSFWGNSIDRNLKTEEVKNDLLLTVGGSAFFSNAELPVQEAVQIVQQQATSFLYRSQSSTSIDKEGIAKDGSLRKMEVVIPCTLIGEIHGIPDILIKPLISSFGFIKRMGMDRNRGLGRCTISLLEKGDEK